MTRRCRSLALALHAIVGCALFRGPDPQQAQADAMAQSQAAFVQANAHMFQHTAEERERFIAEHTEGYEPQGEPIAGQLESFTPVPVSLERGKCYMMVLRLDEAAQFSEHAQGGIAFVYDTRIGEQINGGPGIHGPGGLGSGAARFSRPRRASMCRPTSAARSTRAASTSSGKAATRCS